MKIEPFPGTLEKKAVDRPYTCKSGKTGHTTSYVVELTDEQRDWLCRLYPTTPNSVLMAVSGIKHSALHRFARKWGLVKSEAGLNRIRKYQAKVARKTCEENGYYDSIRGRQPSEACMEGSARRWERVRAGLADSPVAIFRKAHPRAYKKMLAQWAQGRRDLIHKERMRLKYGLTRKTKLVVVVEHPYKRSQVSHRYNAVKKGYLVPEHPSEASGERFNIYYDEQTERSELFERNLVADGFTVLRLNEKRKTYARECFIYQEMG